MFDFDKISKKAFERVLDITGFNFTFPDENSKIRKVVYWYCFKFNPFLLKITTIIAFFWIIHRINLRVGIEQTVIWLLAVLIITMRGLSNKVSGLIEKYK